MKSSFKTVDGALVEVPLQMIIGITQLLFVSFILCNAKKTSKGLCP